MAVRPQRFAQALDVGFHGNGVDDEAQQPLRAVVDANASAVGF